MSLAVKYRPHTFEECVGQDIIIKILKRQVELRQYKNAYLFCGPSGDGKTTLARIFANELNRGHGEPIEIDAASNSGVDNVRLILEDARTRALDADYKIYIIDECHSLSNQAWQAFLKTLEEAQGYTVFIFCTTDPQKIPETILSRLERFNFSRISTDLISERLKYICEQEHFINYDEACNYIARLACGGMRAAISMLEKCAGYSIDLSIKNILNSLGNFSYETYLALVNAIVDGNQKEVISIIENCYNAGGDISLFVDQFLDFIFDLTKYCLFADISMTKIPSYLEATNTPICVKWAIGIENNLSYFNKLSQVLLDLKNRVKTDSDPKLTTEIVLSRFITGGC